MTLRLLLGLAMIVLCASASKADDQVKALIDKSVEAYGKVNAYQHSATCTIKGKSAKGNVRRVLTYTLAVERPKRFCFKCDTAPLVACVCDGLTLVNFDGKKFVRLTAPASLKEIDLVNGVEFEPLGTYIVALMLQGNPYADKDLKAGFEKGALASDVEEDGKKWQVVQMRMNGSPVKVYFNPDDHFIAKLTQQIDRGTGEVSETFGSVTRGAILDRNVFNYSPPKGAKRKR